MAAGAYKKRSFGTDVRALMALPAFVALVAAVCCLQFSLSGLIIWSASLLQRVYGWQLTSAGVILGLMFGLTGMISPVIMSLLGDAMLRRDEGAYPRLLALTSFGAAPALAFGLWSSNGTTAVVLIGAAYILTACYSPLAMASIRMLVDGRQMAQAVSILGIAMNTLGAGLGPLVIGALDDRYRRLWNHGALRLAMAPGVIGFLLAGLLFLAASRSMRIRLKNRSCGA